MLAASSCRRLLAKLWPAAIGQCQRQRWLATGAEVGAASDSSSLPQQQQQQQQDPADSEELGPCALGLFLGNVNPRLTVFPELDTQAEVSGVHQLAEPLDNFIAEEVDSGRADRERRLDASVRDWLSQRGLLGQWVPREHSGLGLSCIERARLSEAAGGDASIGLLLSSHQELATLAVLLSGTEAQRRRYLPALAGGQLLGAFCLTEAVGGGGGGGCRAELSADGRTFVLNGSKIWTANGPDAGLFVTFATVPTEVEHQQQQQQQHQLTGFLVEPQFGGVSRGPPEATLGARAAGVCAVHFDNTPVPIDNVLGGEVGAGVQQTTLALNRGRAGVGPIVAGSMKLLLRQLVAHAVGRRGGGVGGDSTTIAEFPLAQRRLASLACSLYAIESMSYLTAFLQDAYPLADLSVEYAIVKIFASEAADACTGDAVQLAGGQSFMSDFPYERQWRDSRLHLVHHGSNDLLRLFIAGSGLRHSASEFARLGVGRRLRVAAGRSGLALPASYHQNLFGVANSLEQSVDQFMSAVRRCLSYYRQDVMQQQLVLARVADCVIDMFALLACMARASRSKSIGLRSADHELDLVVMLSKQATGRLERNIAGISSENFFARFEDAEVGRIGDYCCKFGGYAADHPLTRNWD